MVCLLSNNFDPYFNLAAEEYLLKNFSTDVFMLWRCDSTIVVGKHQNSLAEINYGYVKKNRIKVARRLTGGGTVYHDLGNLNFSIIKNGQEGELVNFKKFITPIITILNELNLNAIQGEKNDILIDNKKISGNAEHVFKSRILHHGTLLFNSQLNKLTEAIKVKTGKYNDKAVQSNRSEVTNIVNYLNPPISIDKFISYVFKFFLQSIPGTKEYNFSNKDIENIQALYSEKYNTWEWIYGYSPKYLFENDFQIENNNFRVSFMVENGKIKKSHFKTDLISNIDKQKVETGLIGKRHEEKQLKEVLETISTINKLLVKYDYFIEFFF